MLKKNPASPPKLAAFEALWKELFSSPIHLDSALSKASRLHKSALAQAVPPILLRPTSLAEAAGVGVAPGEPWTLAPEALQDWAPARSMAARILDGALEPRRIPRSCLSDFPVPMIEDWTRDWGPKVAEVLAENLGVEPPLSVRVKQEVGAEALKKDWSPQLPVKVSVSDLSPVGVRLASYAPILNSEASERGDFEIQDEGSQVMAVFALWPEKVAHLLSPVPGPAKSAGKAVKLPESAPAWTVVDTCAGAGGKTLALADLLSGKGRVYAYDTSPRKLQALRRRGKRAGVNNIQAVALTEGKDSETVKRFRRRAQAVLVDAPCSGWGVLRRNPDIKWRQDPETLTRMPEIQKRLLALYSDLVAPGGLLTFGVCTFRRAETIDIVEAFLKERPDFEKGPGGFLGPSPCDGFFMQSFRRKA
jgi:16S rRNA (cytosine967-C5)-methyltransferase